MESGALSDKDFPAFSKEVIPFLHVTTRIEGHPYDGLLKEKGFGGFPTLAFMDAEGNVIATHQGERSVKGFRETNAAVMSFQDLKTRIAKGEKGLEFDLFVAEWNLGTLDFEKARARVEGMKKLSDAQRTQAKQIVQDADVLNTASSMRQIREQDAAAEAADAAGKHFHEMFEAGYRPGARAESTFWGMLANWADKNGKVDSLDKAVEWMNKTYGDNARMAERLKALNARVAELKGSSARP